MTSRRRRETPGPSGFLVVDKPEGMTSHDVVQAARRVLGTRRVGHLGTLDPLATGVLVLAVREATKLVPYVAGTKVYRGAIELGVETETLDREGRVVRRHAGPLPDRAAVSEAMARLQGDIEQVPPMYSAVKRGGVPLHRLARRGEVVERAPRKVRVERFALLDYTPPRLEIEVVCSPGTYVRVLAADVGAHLGCGAHLANLCRTRDNAFELSQAVSPAAFEAETRSHLEGRLVAPAGALDLPLLELGVEEARRVSHGGPIHRPEVARATPGSRFQGRSRDAGVLAVLELKPDRRLQPLRVLHLVAPQG